MKTQRKAIEHLYLAYIDAWNLRDAQAMARIVTKDCILVGFDGSQMFGRNAIKVALTQIFTHHPTARYVCIVKGISFLSSEVAILHSVAGMIPPGNDDIKSEVNAIQLLTAHLEEGRWLIATFQNTPAAFHGRPELSEALTNELREAL